MSNEIKDPAEMIKPGAKTRKYVFMGLFFLLGVCLAVFGLWKTLMIAAFAVVGYFIGSMDDIRGGVRKLINKLLPQKNQPMTFSKEEISRLKKEIAEQTKERAKEE